MNINYLIALTILLVSGCTINQQNRIHELLVKKTGYYPRVKDVQVVLDRKDTDAFSLSLKEGMSLSTHKGVYPVLVLKAENIPINKRFVLARIDRVTGRIDPQCEFEALENGSLKIYRQTGISCEQEIPFIASEGFKAGYPIDYAIVSKETYASATAEFIPYPIVVAGDEGEKVEAVVSHPMGTHFQIRASGFHPSERLTLVHTSGDLKEETEISADRTGSFEIGLNPIILGKLGGEAQLVVQRSEGKGDLVLEYPWGTGLEKKTWHERAIFPIVFVANHDPEEQDYVGLIALLE